MDCPERFWLEEPRDLLARFDILPRSTDTWEQKLNSVTRLIILITVILVALKWKHWLTFLLIALILIVFVYLLKQKDPDNHHIGLMEHFNEGTNFKYYKPRNTRARPSRAQNDQRGQALSSFAQRSESCQQPQHFFGQEPTRPSNAQGEEGFTRFVMPGETLVAAPVQEMSQQHEHVAPKPKSKPRRKRKTAYEHARDAWLEDVDEDEVARDRHNLIAAIM